MASDRGSPRGAFIVLEGPDRCGKSTQTRLLKEHLERSNVGAPGRCLASCLAAQQARAA
jgi:thymidylate kinase